MTPQREKVASRGQEVSLYEASKVFASLPGHLQIPSLHPEFVEVDSLRDATAKPVYWVYESAHGLLLKSFLSSSMSVGSKVVRDIQSPYGGGGILVNASHLTFHTEASNQFRQWAVEQRVVVEFLRLHPLLEIPTDYVENSWVNRETVVMFLQDDILAGYSSRKRLYIRNECAAPHELVELKKPSGLKEFINVYAQNMRLVGAQSEYFFSREYLSALIDCPFARLWGLKYDGEVVAVALLLDSLESRVAEYHLGASVRLPGKRPMELLLHLLAKTHGSLGYEVMSLGGGRTVSPTDSLLRFKKSFSSATRIFSVGQNVFLPEQYQEIEGHGEASPHHVLFYRRNSADN